MSWIAAAIGGSALLNFIGSQDAADAQAGAANNAANLQYQMFLANQANYAPWLAAGGKSLDALMWGLGIGNRADYRNAIKAQYTSTGAPVTLQGTLIQGAQPFWDETGNWNPGNPVYQYSDGTTGSTPTKQVAGTAGFDQAGFDQAWGDFKGAGKFGYMNEDFPGADQPFKRDPFKFDPFVFKKEPGYNFRLKEGLKAVENSAAAHGMLHSGRAMKELDRYSQGFASNEFNNAFNRYMARTSRDFNKYAFDQNFDASEYMNAFNRFMTQQGNQYNRIANAAGMGQSSVNQVANANNSYAVNQGNNYMNYGNALASGYMGGANAINSGVNAGLNAYYQNQFMQNAFPTYGLPPMGSSSYMPLYGGG